MDSSTGLITFLAVTFFCWPIFGVDVVRTSFGLCFVVVTVGSALGATDMQPVSAARAPDRTAAINACFTALPTVTSLCVKTSPVAGWLAPKPLWLP